MMNDKEFFELELRAMIVPKQASWPAPEHVHWAKLHAAADEARVAVSAAYSTMAKIDADKGLSREAKAQHRHTVAKQAIAEIEKSRALVKAREAVRYVMEQWNRDDVSPEIVEARAATLNAMKEAEQGWQKAMDKIAERVSLTKGPDTRR
jgi:hypothetical protein